MTDTPRVLMLHRWLGTATVACAGSVLAPREVSPPPQRSRTRAWFRVSPLVVAVPVLVTGFFGAAVASSIDRTPSPP